MKTNEQVQKGLVQEAEASIVKMMEQMQRVPTGDLKGVEQIVMSTCLAVGRGWLEQVMNQQEQAALARREGECGHRQRLVGERPKQLLTLMGKVTVHRAYYQCLLSGDEERAERTGCAHGQAPFDQVWGMQAGRSSPGVQQVVSELGASMTLEEAATIFQAILPLKMSARQVLTLLQPVGATLRTQEDAQKAQLFHAAADAHQALPTQEHGSLEHIGRMYIELDGVLARMRRGSVPMQEHEEDRAGDVYREIKVGAVFTAMRGRKRSDLSAGPRIDAAGPIQYVARRTSADTFGAYLYSLAHQQGIEQAEQVVVLGDGAAWIWRLAAEHFPHAVHIVDLWHAREHVWKVAHAVFGRGHPQEAAWARSACDLLSDGCIDALVQMIEQLPSLPPEPGAARSVAEIEADYFRTNASRMRYPTFRAQGMQIGTGVAEAACKTVVSTRAKRAGMRWTPDGLDAVLAIRTSVLNGTYRDFCQTHHQLIA